MAKQEFIIEKSSEYTLDDGTVKYANKLVAKSEDDMFGHESQLTLYIHGKKPLEVGAKIEFDPNDWVIEERPFTLPEGADNAGEVIQLKTMVRKAS